MSRDKPWSRRKVVLSAQGDQSFASWTQRVKLSASFYSIGIPNTSPNYDVIGFTNNSGAGAATAEHYVSYADMTFGTGTNLEDIHTVSMRMTRTNDSVTIAASPATAIHTGGAGQPGNCYFAFARYDAGTAKVGLAAFFLGTFVLLAEFAYTVSAGDVLSIRYQYNTLLSRAELAVLVNGASIATFNSPGGYRMSTLSAKPGIVGIGSPSIPTAGSGFGHWFAEWWVTNSDETEFMELDRPYPGKVGDVKVRIMETQRFSTDPTPKAKYLFGAEIVNASFAYKRLGGCTTAKVTLLLQDWVEGVTPNPMSKSLEEPFSEEWNDFNWMGGDFVLSCSYSARAYAIGDFVDEDLWRGEVTKIDFDRRTKVATITARGLTESLKDHYVDKYVKEGETIRTAVATILGYALKTGTNDGRILATDIIGIQSVLDQIVDVDFEAVSCRDALEEVLRVVPDGVIWGTDRNGTFYVQQQLDHYTEDLSGGIYFPHFDADFVTAWKKTNDFTPINKVQVLGKEVEEGQPVFDTIERFSGEATMERYRSIRGTRKQIIMESSIVDRGLAAKLAQVTLKRTGGHKLAAKLTTLEPIEGTRSFWHALVPFRPYVSIQERLEPDANLTDPRLSSTDFYSVHDEMIRLYGDLPGYAAHLDGASGGKLSIASTASEQNLTGFNWMMQVSLKFTSAHTGGLTSQAHVVGRAEAGVNVGWGYLSWQEGTGNLFWNYRTNGGLTRLIWTGINVPAAAPANAVVNFTVWRDNVGDFHFYNGGTLGATVATYRTDVIRTSTADWSIFSGDHLAVGWEGDAQEFRVFDTTALHTSATGGPSTGVLGFLARNNGTALHRNEALGLLRYAKLNEPYTPGGIQLAGSVCWFRNGVNGTPTSGAWIIGSIGPVSSASFVSNMRQAWKLGDSSGSSVALGLKKWGGPLVLLVEGVSYSVKVSTGMVETSFKLGADTESFEKSIADVTRQVERQGEILKKIKEDF